MSREIKFRAWDERNREMVYSDREDSFYVNTVGVLFMYAIPMSEAGLQKKYHKDYGVMQYTGLTDKNGKEIYEGDILQPERFKRIKFYNFPVVYSEGVFRCSGKLSGFDTLRESLAHARKAGNEFLVIGNIYENPELLNDKTN